MEISREFVQEYGSEHILVPGTAQVGEALQAFRDRGGKWWWLLVVELSGSYATCSFGSLLPYLAGETPHIVHNIGDCAICSGMDPMFWRDSEALLERVLGAQASISRCCSDLPLRTLPVIDIRRKDMDNQEVWGPWSGSNVRGYIEDGAFLGVYVERMRDSMDGMPKF